MTTPRVYFADLAAYNAGRLRGVWVEFFEGIEPDKVQFAIDAMLKSSEGEEWRIDDYENFAEFTSCDLEKLCQVAALIHEHGEEPIKGYFAHRGDDAEIDEFTDYYIGCYKSEAAFCKEHLGEEGGICEAAEAIQVFDWATLDKFIDWEAIANDAFINSYYSHEEGYEKTHVYLR
ncbi:antirestriction protein ArdA [Leptolyngbya sp. FACHB-17]|uniref:antirestriction protein ArdA n=1 Tax=unclassified Leptolyngbya TaxID=2650499 RepID=UPI00168034AE|nr:antirestriction protein ArdA [Leptolyngbya sp. FACHB-17]MBD2078427.1 antirestriction protein ArdA [Leptolyngbya sp. FACHB-17]